MSITYLWPSGIFNDQAFTGHIRMWPVKGIYSHMLNVLRETSPNHSTAGYSTPKKLWRILLKTAYHQNIKRQFTSKWNNATQLSETKAESWILKSVFTLPFRLAAFFTDHTLQQRIFEESLMCTCFKCLFLSLLSYYFDIRHVMNQQFVQGVPCRLAQCPLGCPPTPPCNPAMDNLIQDNGWMYV